jgi:hypothetical protein
MDNGGREDCTKRLNDNELMEMILKSAINDYLGYEPKRVEYRCAFEWLFSDFDENESDKVENAANGFVSLFMVCDLLELNYEKLRVLIKCYEDKGKTRLVESQFREMFRGCRLG